MTETKKSMAAVDIRNSDEYIRQIGYIEQKLSRKLTGAEREDLKREIRQQTWLSVYFETGNITTACIVTGISRSQFNTWRSLYPVFAEAVNEVIEAEIDFVESKLMQNIKSGKETSIIFWLCNKGRHRQWQSVNKIKNQSDKGKVYTIFYGRIGQDGNVKQVSSTERKALMINDGDVVIGVKPTNGGNTEQTEDEDS